MTRDEQIDLLKGLLARVRAGAMARGVELPKDHTREAATPRDHSLPTSAPRESSAPLSIELDDDVGYEPLVAEAAAPQQRNGSGLTAFAETGAGTHAPLALVGAPPSEPAAAVASQAAAAAALAPTQGLVDDDDDDDDGDLPRTAVSISFANDSPYAQPHAPPTRSPPSRRPFDAAFEDEITSNGDPAEIEAAVLASAAAEPQRIPTPPPTPAPITRVPTGVPPAPPTRVVTPVPPAPPTRVVPPTNEPAPQRMSSLPAVPLTLDDLDLEGLGTPEAAISVPPPRAASYMPPSRISHPPVMAVPPPAPLRIPTPPSPAAYVPTPPPPRVVTPPSPAAYVPTPPPPRVVTPPPPRVPTPPPYVPTPPPPRIPTPTAPAYVATPPPPPLIGAAEVVELEDSDVVESPRAMPDPTATLPGSSAPYATSAFERDSAPDPQELDEEVPASQRQMRVEDRPLDDALEGISEPPPESGEVESQRYTKVAEEIEQTTEVRALASVDVVDRPALELEGVAVASFSGKLASAERPTFGEILDSALDL